MPPLTWHRENVFPNRLALKKPVFKNIYYQPTNKALSSDFEYIEKNPKQIYNRKLAIIKKTFDIPAKFERVNIRFKDWLKNYDMSLSKSLIIISLDDITDDKTSASKKFLSISKKNIILSLNEVPDHNGKSSAFKVDIGSVDTVNNMISAFIENKGLCRVDIKSENKDS